MSDDCLRLLTHDDALAAEVQRLAAAAGALLRLDHSIAEVLPQWASAPAILVGADQAEALAGVGLPRRPQVHVLALGQAPDRLFRAALHLGATAVLELPEADGWLMEMLTDLSEEERAPGTTVGVVGGGGGAGASVLAAALALHLGRRGSAMAVDLDPLGPGLGRLMGAEESAGLGWQELSSAPGRLGARAVREALPRVGGAGVLSWGPESRLMPSPGLVHEVVSAGRRGHQVVVVDLPREQVGSPGSLVHCDHLVLVVRNSLAAIASAAAVASHAHNEATGVGIVVRTRRAGVGAEQVAGALGRPLWAELGEQRRLDEHLDLGLGPLNSGRGPLATAVEELAGQLGLAR